MAKGQNYFKQTTLKNFFKNDLFASSTVYAMSIGNLVSKDLKLEGF